MFRRRDETRAILGVGLPGSCGKASRRFPPIHSEFCVSIGTKGVATLGTASSHGIRRITSATAILCRSRDLASYGNQMLTFALLGILFLHPDCSQRNAGCRFASIVLHGVSWVVLSGSVSLKLGLAGLDLAGFEYRKGMLPRNFLATLVVGMSALSGSSSFEILCRRRDGRRRDA